MKVLLRTPAVAPVITAGAVQDPEEPVMSITAWIVPWPLDRAVVAGQADPARRPGRAPL
jgi:hypothetical protein